MKREIRRINKEKRNAMSMVDVERKSTLAANKFLLSDLYINSKCIMLYMPLGNETDTRLIIKKALADKKKVVLPVTDMVNTDIIPCIIDENTPFKTGAYLIDEPDTTKKASEEEIDVVLVPGIAFGRNGARVGFGKGYYDRFLSGTKAVKAGFCYDFQLIDEIVPSAYDVPMDYIFTDSEIIKV